MIIFLFKGHICGHIIFVQELFSLEYYQMDLIFGNETMFLSGCKDIFFLLGKKNLINK